MKKKVQDFVKSHVAETKYAGKTQTMFIKGADAANIKSLVQKQFGTLPFKLEITTK